VVVLVSRRIALQVAAGTDDLIACLTRAHTAVSSASVAVARLGLAAAADLADNQDACPFCRHALVVSASWRKMSA
jgi:hypothetical protein